MEDDTLTLEFYHETCKESRERFYDVLDTFNRTPTFRIYKRIRLLKEAAFLTQSHMLNLEGITSILEKSYGRD